MHNDGDWPVRPRMLNFSSMTTAQPAPAHLLDERRAQRAHAVAELLAEPLRALFDQNVQCGHRHGAAERVPNQAYRRRDERKKWVKKKKGPHIYLPGKKNDTL